MLPPTPFAESTNESTHNYCDMLFFLKFLPKPKGKSASHDSGESHNPFMLYFAHSYVIQTRNYRGKVIYYEWTWSGQSYGVLPAGDSFHLDNIIIYIYYYSLILFFSFFLPGLSEHHAYVKHVFLLSLTEIMNFHPLYMS